MLKPPNQPLQQTGHANDVAADFFAAGRTLKNKTDSRITDNPSLNCATATNCYRASLK
jgi:hypothetical protein